MSGVHIQSTEALSSHKIRHQIMVVLEWEAGHHVYFIFWLLCTCIGPEYLQSDIPILNKCPNSWKLVSEYYENWFRIQPISCTGLPYTVVGREISCTCRAVVHTVRFRYCSLLHKDSPDSWITFMLTNVTCMRCFWTPRWTPRARLPLERKSPKLK